MLVAIPFLASWPGQCKNNVVSWLKANISPVIGCAIYRSTSWALFIETHRFQYAIAFLMPWHCSLPMNSVFYFLPWPFLVFLYIDKDLWVLGQLGYSMHSHWDIHVCMCKSVCVVVSLKRRRNFVSSVNSPLWQTRQMHPCHKLRNFWLPTIWYYDIWHIDATICRRSVAFALPVELQHWNVYILLVFHVNFVPNTPLAYAHSIGFGFLFNWHRKIAFTPIKTLLPLFVRLSIADIDCNRCDLITANWIYLTLPNCHNRKQIGSVWLKYYQKFATNYNFEINTHTHRDTLNSCWF